MATPRLPLDAKIESGDLRLVLKAPPTAAPGPQDFGDFEISKQLFKSVAPQVVRVSWIGRPELPPVSQQLPFGTCLAHALCRLQETLVALRGHSISLDPELFHQCVAGLDCHVGQPQPHKHVKLMCDVGAPSIGTGFEPDDPCPNPRPAMSRAGGAKLITNAAVAKRMIAEHAPIVAVISAEKRFGLVGDGAIYRDTGGPADLHHALLLVGFDDDAGCWEVQNSFGTGWGKAGYSRIAYGHCAILQDNRHPAFALA